MRIAECHLRSMPGSPYSASRKHNAKKLPKESHEAYELRTWKEKAYYNDKGQFYIPPMSFKNAVASTAQLLQIVIPGKKGQTFTKHFLNGVQVFEPLILPDVTRDNVKGEEFSCHANGKRGSGSRVDRTFPMVEKWEGIVNFMIVNNTITNEVFEQVLHETGSLNGIGRFRPQNGGMNGRFEVVKIKWIEK